MFEARLEAAVTLKKLLDAIKELVTDANIECNDEGLKLQAMDNSHVALVAVTLETGAFNEYRCDRPMALGVNLASLTKVLKCAKDDDVVTLKANDNADVLYLTYEAKKSDRVSSYELKLMDIDMDELGIPDTDYDARVTMSSAEFQRICRDLSSLGESVRVEVSKDGVRFTSDGEAANGNVLLKQTDGAASRYRDWGKGADEKADDGEEQEEGTSSKKKANGVKKEKDGEDAEMEDEVEEVDPEREEDDGGEYQEKAKKEDAEDEEEEEEEESSSKNKKRKRPAAPSKPAKKPRKSTKKSGDDDDEGAPSGVYIEMTQAVNLTFSLKYLINFAKSAGLIHTVQLKMSNDVPLLVAYEYGPGHIHYYLAPKIGDE